MPSPAAIGSFFAEFSRFEAQSLRQALSSLSKDSVFVDRAETLLELEARLTLLQRMAAVRGVPPSVMQELNTVLKRARKLGAQREAVAARLRAPASPLSPIAKLEDLAAEAVELQAALGAITQQFETRPAAGAA